MSFSEETSMVSKDESQTGTAKTPMSLDQGNDVLTLCLVLFLVPMGISPMGNLSRFSQGKPAATVSRYPTPN